MTVAWEDAQKLADDVLKKYGVTDPLTDVFEIARAEGLTVIPLIPGTQDRQFSGFLDTNDQKPTIYVNANEPTARRTWTLGHELGHYFLNHPPDERGINWRDHRPGEEKNEYEQAADYFAACLLIPEKILKKTMKEYALTSENYALLADMFGVSMDAMKNRLSFLRL